MTLEEDVRYLKDRAELHERTAMYALGQDFHQPGWEDQDSYQQWSEVFADDVEFDVSDTGRLEPVGLTTYIALMRDRQPDQPGIAQYFNLWAHLEHPVRITINGDEASSIALHIHSMKPRRGRQQFPRRLLARPLEAHVTRWRIDRRRPKQLFIHTFPLMNMEKSLLGLKSSFRPAEGFDLS